MPRRPKFSDFDLLRLLRENARMTYTELGRRLGVSDTAVRKRMKILEQLGVIVRYTVEVNPRMLGMVIAFIGVDVRPEKYVEVLEELRRMDEVVSLYATSGDHNIVAECWFRSHEEFVEFVLSEVLAEEPEQGMSKEDEEKVKERLRALGYL